MEKPAITRINGGFEIVANPKSEENQGFYLPQVTDQQKAAITPERAVMVYNNGTYEVKDNNQWFSLNRSPAATGAGLAPQASPVVFPSAPSADVEGALVNQINGFTYYDVTTQALKTRVNGAWVTITTA